MPQTGRPPANPGQLAALPVHERLLAEAQAKRLARAHARTAAAGGTELAECTFAPKVPTHRRPPPQQAARRAPQAMTSPLRVCERCPEPPFCCAARTLQRVQLVTEPSRHLPADYRPIQERVFEVQGKRSQRLAQARAKEASRRRARPCPRPGHGRGRAAIEEACAEARAERQTLPASRTRATGKHSVRSSTRGPWSWPLRGQSASCCAR